MTENLFRCKLSLVMKGERIPCNALVWRERPDKMREHMIDHMTQEEIDKLSDDEIRAMYIDAARIHQEGIPQDDDDAEDE